MKNWGRGIVVAVAVAVIIVFVLAHKHEPPIKKQPELGKLPAASAPPSYRIPPGFKRAVEMTDEKKAGIAKRFREKFQPALERWGKAYAGRIPFKLDDVTADKFHDVDDDLYTYMIGSTTLVFKDDGDSANVVYMMTKGGAAALNSIPRNGLPPDLSLPVTREQILEMVKEDRGVAFSTDKVKITPSGAGFALPGGALVDVNVTMVGNMGELIDGKSFSMVFDKNGQLVNYEGPMR